MVILDNDFRDPDVDRYLSKFEKHDPSVAIIGDAYTPVEAEGLNKLVNQLNNTFPYKEYVVVPKCKGCFSQLDDDVVLGYPMGYSDLQPSDYSDLSDWRGRRVHFLGASPIKQNAIIEELTQPTLTDQPPADIVGLDWNGIHKGATLGEYWTPSGWEAADYLTIRETVRHSLRNIKEFWQHKGVWPTTEPIEIFGEAVREPDDLLYATTGRDIHTREQLEDAHVRSYDDGRTLAYKTETERSYLEWREGLPSEN